jgi:hypothetical protein
MRTFNPFSTRSDADESLPLSSRRERMVPKYPSGYSA